jgi:UDP-N-acetylmuramyl tripeptide synthase
MPTIPAADTLFEDSRRLTGPNLYFGGPGVALTTLVEADDAVLVAWRARVALACTALDWPKGPRIVREHRGGATLAFTAPIDQLYAATEVNEWAWLSALHSQGVKFTLLHRPGHPALDDETDALRLLALLAAGEQQPAVAALADAAEVRGLPCLIDEATLSIGAGKNGQCWPIEALPSPDAVAWDRLRSIPMALVTGSNGKTTTVRLLAAMMRAQGLRTAHSCTDGLYFDGELLEGGDYSGPVGARTVLRHPEAQAAILETARGGMLRRGLAVRHADVAVITNISADHFGEYGIVDLDGLTQVKMIVARAIDANGLLVLNADDPQLRRHAASVDVPLAWFSLDDDSPLLHEHRASGGWTMGVLDGRLRLFDGRARHDLGAVADMPITLGGHATHNIANIAAASLAAVSLGIAPSTITTVLANFGRDHRDNIGRLQCWSLGTATVYLDYAHNPDGLRHLLDVAARERGSGRLALVLGQAGNRGNDAIAELAGVAAAYRPDLVLLKDIVGYMRGRESGEVAGVLRNALTRGGVPDERIVDCLDEVDAVREILAWARAGDLLVLPIHGSDARARVCTLLDHLFATNWRPGEPLPVADPGIFG